MFFRGLKSLDIRNSSGWTPLMYASIHGHLDVVNDLINSNSSVHICNDSGLNALMLTVKFGNVKIINSLVKVIKPSYNSCIS